MKRRPNPPVSRRKAWRGDRALSRALRFGAGFAVFVLAAGLIAGMESRWELWTTGLLGLLACVVYPETRARPLRRAPLRLRDECEPRHARPRRGPLRARALSTKPPRGSGARDCIANVSHELRAPLTVLLGFVETVRDLELGPAASRDYLDRMEIQCRRMQGIIDDMLKVSALEAAPAAAERVEVASLLERVRGEAEALSAGRHSISLEAEGRYDLLGAEREIASAFGNLASNAVRYTPAGGRIRLIWRASPGGAEFSVEDSGVGIAPEHLPRLTERFYRVDRPRGTGLGRAIVEQALSRHQGRLQIESEPGRGSRFTARFPAHRVIAAPGARLRAIA